MSNLDDFNAHTGVVFGIIAGVVICVLGPVGLWCTYDRNDDEIAKAGGPLYAFWLDFNACLFGCVCPYWQLAEATAEAVNGSCICNCCLMIWCPCFCHCCLASELASASQRWGGQRYCFHRYLGIIFCPCLVSMQAARAMRRRRAINAGLDVGTTPFKTHASAPPALVLGAAAAAAPRTGAPPGVVLGREQPVRRAEDMV